ncbi:hypothetical protein, partial [Salmonella sp. SAL4437]|uniref:hypothetical protein n=1 Tax=Salmonella sp. SAL4437 TaxID=3159892 RepID=UPI00397E4427
LQAVPRLGVSRVVWEGASPLTAAALLQAASAGDGAHSTLGEARAWLRQALAAGPRPAKELESEARTLGIALRTYHEAR